MDFTTMDDTAALDPATPATLRIASFRVSPTDLVRYTTEIIKDPFKLVRMGSLEELAAHNKAERVGHPEGEHEIYPRWQRGQYMQSMFSTQHVSLDNERYPDLRWSSLSSLLSQRAGGGLRTENRINTQPHQEITMTARDPIG
jgi:hypothetical protein